MYKGVLPEFATVEKNVAKARKSSTSSSSSSQLGTYRSGRTKFNISICKLEQIQFFSTLFSIDCPRHPSVFLKTQDFLWKIMKFQKAVKRARNRQKSIHYYINYIKSRTFVDVPLYLVVVRRKYNGKKRRKVFLYFILQNFILSMHNTKILMFVHKYNKKSVSCCCRKNKRKECTKYNKFSAIFLISCVPCHATRFLWRRKRNKKKDGGVN